MRGEPPSSATHWTSLKSWTPLSTEGRGTEKEEFSFSFNSNPEFGHLLPTFSKVCSALYLSAKRKLGELLDGERVKRLPSGVHLHPTQHHDDSGHDQGQEPAGVDDDVGILGLDGVHRHCGFLLCHEKEVRIQNYSDLQFSVIRCHLLNLCQFGSIKCRNFMNQLVVYLR